MLAFALRVLRLDYVNFHSDEASFIRIAYQGALLQATAYDDPHPPLFLAMLQAWMGPAGISQVGIRMLPILYGTLLAPVTYQLGRLCGNRRLGLAGAFVVAANPVFIFYAKEVRDNGLMAFTGALSFVLLMLALRRPAVLPAYVLAALAALFSHYYDIPIVGLELVVAAAWLTRRRKLRLWPWAAVPAALALGYAPWLLYARSTIANYDVGHGSWRAFWDIIRQTYQAFNFGFSVRTEDLLWPGVVMGGLLLLGIAGALAIRRGTIWFLLAYIFTPIAFGAATLLHQTNFNPRYLFAGAPAYALLLGAALVLLQRWHWAAAALASAFLLALTGYTIRNTDFDPEFQPNGYRGMVAYLEHHATARDAMVLDGVSQWPLYFYYGQLRAHLPQQVEFLPRETPAATQQAVDGLLGKGGVWYLETDLLRYDPDHETERQLAAAGYEVLDNHFGGQRLEYFAGSASGPLQPVDASAGSMRLTAATKPDRPVSAGQPIAVELDWQRAGQVSPFKLSLRLDGPEGTAAQNDSLPLGGYADFGSWASGQTLRDRAGLLVPVGTLPGTYTLRALAYDAASGAPLGPALELGRVAVDHSAPQDPAAAGLPLIGASITGTASSGATGEPGSLRLEAGEVPPGGVKPGDRVAVTLLWSGRPTAHAQHVSLAVGGQHEDHMVGGERYPTTAWQAGDIVRDVASIRVPPATPAGRYPVSVEGVVIGSLRVLPVQRSFTPPPLAHPVNARFGDVAELLGYDVQRRGGGLHVQLIWRALADGSASYTVFVHALGPDGAVASQADVPAGTDRWVKGQVVTTSYDLTSPPAGYQLEVGLYDPTSGRRLRVGGGRDSVVLPG